MIQFRPINLDTDYATLESWSKGHKSLPPPRAILPRGWIAEASGVPIAMSFLYMDPMLIGVIEWTTTNPACAFSRELVLAVKGLYSHLEQTAKDAGCVAVISFVKPRSSEERIMTKMGFATSADDTGHRLFAKPLRNLDKWDPPKDGVMPCPSPS